MDFCGLADFENTVDRVSAVIFDTGTVLCLSYVRILGPRQPLDHRSDLSSTLVGMSMSSSLFFFEISSFKLSCKTVIGIVLCYSHQACYHTSLLLNLYTSDSGCRCVFGFEQNFWRIRRPSRKKARIGGFPYPYSSPHSCSSANCLKLTLTKA